MATNEEILLTALANGTQITEFQPQTNEQAYLAYLCGAGNVLPEPRTAKEVLLYNLCKSGISGGGGGNELFALLVQNQLTDITAEDSKDITSISTMAFNSKKALITANFPNAKTIGWQAFSGCTGLTTISLPSVVDIAGQAFASCSSLQEIDLPLTTTIGGLAFSSCKALKKVSLGLTVPKGDSFSGCSALETLILRKTTEVAALSSTSAIPSSCPIATGTGYIYVPRALLEEYKVATNWTTYAEQFRAIEDYPEICGGAE